MAKETEIEIFNRSFIPPNLDFTPDDIMGAFGQLSNEDLWRGLMVGEDVKVKVAYQQGWALIILKTRLGHGSFKAALKEREIPYHKANGLMNIARGCLRHPGLQAITSLKMLRRIFYLPEELQDKIEIELTETIGENGERTWTDVRGWIVERIAEETVSKVKHDNAVAHRRAKKTPVMNPAIVAEEDPAFVELRRTFHEDARGGINRFGIALRKYLKRPNIKASGMLVDEVGGNEQSSGWARQLRLAQDELIPELGKLLKRLDPLGSDDD